MRRRGIHGSVATDHEQLPEAFELADRWSSGAIWIIYRRTPATVALVDLRRVGAREVSFGDLPAALEAITAEVDMADATED